MDDKRTTVSRRVALASVGALALAALSGCAAPPEPMRARRPLSATDGRAGGQLLITAHPDDDLFFMSPDMLDGLRDRGSATTTVYATAGDAGEGFGYWGRREQGVRSAYATMAGLADRWSSAAYRVAGRAVDVHVLAEAPDVRLVFLHLPDGGVDGTGYASTGAESLLRLRSGEQTTVHTIDGRRQAYTATGLTAVLEALVRWSEPAVLRTLDCVAPLTTEDDHTDHTAIARFAQDALAASGVEADLVPYKGYAVADSASNVSGERLAAKQEAFLAYAPYDSKTCGSLAACSDKPEGAWLTRQYRAG